MKKVFVYLFNRCYLIYFVIFLLMSHLVNHQRVIFKTLDAFRRAESDVVLQAQGKDVMKDFVLWDAIRYYKNIAVLIPDSAIAHSLIGFCYYQAKDYDHAIKKYQKAIELDDEYFGLHYNLGIIYFRLKEYEQSIKHFKKTLKVNPNKELTHLGLISPFVQSQSKSSSNVQIFKDTYFDSYKHIVSSYFHLKEYTAVLKHSLTAISLDLNNKDFFYYYASISAYHLKEYKLAIHYGSKALEINPKYADVYQILGKSFEKAELIGLAKNAFSQESILRQNSKQMNPGEILKNQDLFLYIIDAKKYFNKNVVTR